VGDAPDIESKAARSRDAPSPEVPVASRGPDRSPACGRRSPGIRGPSSRASCRRERPWADGPDSRGEQAKRFAFPALVAATATSPRRRRCRSSFLARVMCSLSVLSSVAPSEVHDRIRQKPRSPGTHAPFRGEASLRRGRRVQRLIVEESVDPFADLVCAVSVPRRSARRCGPSDPAESGGHRPPPRASRPTARSDPTDEEPSRWLRRTTEPRPRPSPW